MLTKMKITTGLQCPSSLVRMCKLLLCLCLLHCVLIVNAKSLDHQDHHQSHHPTKDTEYGGDGDGNSCESVAHYFDSLNVTVRPDVNGKTGEFILFLVCYWFGEIINFRVT